MPNHNFTQVISASGVAGPIFCSKCALTADLGGLVCQVADAPAEGKLNYLGVKIKFNVCVYVKSYFYIQWHKYRTIILYKARYIMHICRHIINQLHYQFPLESIYNCNVCDVILFSLNFYVYIN